MTARRRRLFQGLFTRMPLRAAGQGGVPLLSLLFAALASTALGQVPILLPEFQVSTSAPGGSYFPGIAMGKDGRFVVTWSGVGMSDADIFGRTFDTEATPLDDPFLANEITTGNQTSPSVARDAAGRFIVVWGDENASILGRRFGADGAPLGNSFQISTSLAMNPASVASDRSGNFVVAWNSNDGVVARRFDSNGAALGDPFPVGGSGDAPRLAMSAAGFVVAWPGFARRFDPAGNPMTDVITVVPPFHGAVVSTDVAMGDDGAFVVVWDDYVDPCVPICTPGAPFVVAGPKGHRFFSDGTSRGVPFGIQTGGWGPRVASDSVNNFIVTWNSDSGSRARYYDIFGQAVSSDFPVSEVFGAWTAPALADDGSFVMAWMDGSVDVKGRKSAIRAASAINLAAGNGVLEPGETVTVESAWVNDSAADVELSGAATKFTGPAGADYSLADGAAYYGTIGAGQTSSCLVGTNCYSVKVSDPAIRPVQHWDAQLQETLSIGVPKSWVLHIGGSFPDVPTGNPFYTFIETILHNGVTAGCAGGGYCPDASVTRAQMSVFLLKSKFGAAHIPPPCTGTVFADVPCTGGPFDPWIEELAALGIAAGCGGGFAGAVDVATQPQVVFCPNDAVTRQQMAVLLLKTKEGSTYLPPACAGVFADVPCTPGVGFSDWIEELYNRSITGGCSSSPLAYCPTNPNNRGQMAAFLSKTFGLVLYGGS